ncbi:YdcH family protein [Coralloluteibacterium stylophorae]|uniref:YdcH family protein n=1 Tax=Coralloluteibacterium stylophorae TaxID=1776034 RepID=A0A8J7VVS6_9GAMM|nr:YdcH family protein [Coralloluteibacterium stylophorae]MBS7457840.1 YdcH family protein [Coralloluteibacterium stylophorae]
MFEGQSPAELDAILNDDSELRSLYLKHRDLDQRVIDAELGVRPVDDMTLARLKKEKLQAKDRLSQRYEARTH